jgi:hypothetical protein
MLTFKAARLAPPPAACSCGKPCAAAAMAAVTAMDPFRNQSGGFRLAAGQALSLRARQAGRLHVVQGRLWVTLSNAAQDGRVRAGDHVLLPGDSLALSAGEAVVIESWVMGGQSASASIRWEPAPRAGLRARFESIGLPGALAFAFRQ